MGARRRIITAVIATLVLKILAQAQVCNLDRTRQGPTHLLWPYTAEYREKIESADYEGRPKPIHEHIRVVAQDSQGRHLDRWVGADGNSHSQIRDPVAGEEIFWNTSSAKAKVVEAPAAVPGRRSCWEGPGSRDLERLPVGDEPRTGWSAFSCAPAGQNTQGCRDACEAERLAHALPAEKKFPKCRAERGGTAEDLGMDVIQGVAAHGCRKTTTFPDGKRKLWEVWSDEHGLTVRDIQEHSDDDRFFKELTGLSLDEPSPSMFRPPEGYEIITLEMHEVPCEQPTARLR